MDFSLDDDQALLVSSLQTLTADHQEIPAAARLDYAYYDAALQAQLVENGFNEAGLVMGALGGALLVYEAGRVPGAVETAISSLLLSQVDGAVARGPVSFVERWQRPARYLNVAPQALVVDGDDYVLIDVDPENVTGVESILAYPYGKFSAEPDLSSGRRFSGDDAQSCRRWLDVGLAAEAAAAIRSAVDFTVDYVKERHLFGRALGSYQSVHHRLAHAHQVGRAAYVLVMHAAWKGADYPAATAVTYVQQALPKLLFDLHQFNGAMGLTNEHLLHRWTYRLRALQGELGGIEASAKRTAGALWKLDAA